MGIHCHADELVLHQANRLFGPDLRRTAASARSSANSDGYTPAAGPDKHRLALSSSLLASFPDAQQPGDVLEARLAFLRFDRLMEFGELLGRNGLRFLGRDCDGRQCHHGTTNEEG